MNHAMFGRGAQSRAKVGEIVDIGARGNGIRRDFANPRIQVRFAVIAAVDGIRPVAGIVLLARIEQHERPIVPRSVRFDARSRRGGNRRTRRVIHRRARTRKTPCGVRERHRIDAAAHGERESIMAVE
jgi:hypothetical protein